MYGSEKPTVLWEKGIMRLNCIFKDGIGCVYLWKGSRRFLGWVPRLWAPPQRIAPSALFRGE